jgi:Cu(I)/Ag(I) efflux system membrane fusion protein
MNTINRKWAVMTFFALLLGAGGGYLGSRYFPVPHSFMDMPSTTAPAGPAQEERKVLYWYDPMYPQQKFDQPGKSPFMDMQLVPKYADEDDVSAVKIDPQQTQNIAIRYTTVRRGMYAGEIHAAGTLNYNDRNVAKVQTRTSGFVERVYPLAPGDIIAAGTPIADILVPEWAAAQIEFLTVLKTGESALIDAARERMKLLGMPATLIKRVEQYNKTQTVITIHSPIAGAIQYLEVRNGMTVSMGETLARINGLETVWLDVAVPTTQSGSVNIGDQAEAKFSAYPGEVFTGKVIALLPEIDPGSRTLVVRIELENRDIRLRPGMYADVILREADQKPVLLVDSEAVIRTGRRALVMLAEEHGRFRPVEVQIGPEMNDMTVILSGLEEGQRVVASGQFLIDSEASLRGIVPRAAEKMDMTGEGE